MQLGIKTIHPQRTGNFSLALIIIGCNVRNIHIAIRTFFLSFENIFWLQANDDP
jgi:hypothetical protein